MTIESHSITDEDTPKASHRKDSSWIWWLWGRAHGVEYRLFILNEYFRLQRLGWRFPKKTLPQILCRPVLWDHAIGLLSFIPRPVPAIRLLDIGANVGLFSVQFLEIFPEAEVLAFECGSQAYAALHNRFHQLPQVHLFNLALSSASGVRNFKESKNTIYSTFETYAESENQGLDIQQNLADQVQVRCARFDSLPIHLDDGVFTVGKIDVQGHEIDVIQGIGDQLSHIQVLLVEVSFAPNYHDKTPSFSKVCHLLSQHGLYPAIFHRYGVQMNSYARERDVLFVREPLLARLYWKNQHAPAAKGSQPLAAT